VKEYFIEENAYSTYYGSSVDVGPNKESFTRKFREKGVGSNRMTYFTQKALYNLREILFINKRS
jgi:hypothetical protein